MLINRIKEVKNMAESVNDLKEKFIAFSEESLKIKEELDNLVKSKIFA